MGAQKGPVVQKKLVCTFACYNRKALVPKKGLEPPHPCEYMDLNHARLPIPPLRHETIQRVNDWIGSNY